MSSTVKERTTGHVGGDGGDAFNDFSSVPIRDKPLVQINIRCAKFIDQIQIQYTATNNPGTHGGGGGSQAAPFVLSPGERIVTVSGRAGTFVDGLQFTTDQGRQSDYYGGDGGAAFKFDAPSGYSLQYISGRAGSYVDQLCFHWVSDPPVLYELTDLKYNFPPVTGSDPKSINSTWVANNGSTDAAVSPSVTNSISWTESSTQSYSTTKSVTAGVKLTVSEKVSATVDGIGAESSVSLETSLSTTFSSTWNESTTETSQQTQSWTANIPPKTQLRATLTLWQAKCDVPYAATMKTTFASGTQTTESITGVFKGVLTARSAVTFESQKITDKTT